MHFQVGRSECVDASNKKQDTCVGKEEESAASFPFILRGTNDADRDEEHVCCTASFL